MTLTPVPLPLLEDLAAQYRAKQARPEGSRRNGYKRDPPPDSPSYEEIEAALSHLPAHFGPNSYETWLKVLMAVHSALPGADGAALCERYVPGYEGEVAAKFEGFEQGNGVSVGTLFYVAGQHGYRPRRGAPREAYDATRELTDNEIAAVILGKPGIPFDIYEYRAEDGGILDAWLDHYAHDWLYVTGYDAWYPWQGTHWSQDQQHSIDREIADLLSAMNKAAEDKLQEAFAEEDEDVRKTATKKATAYITATRRMQSRVNSVRNMGRGFRAISGAMINRGNQLNLANGTLDLPSCRLQSHSRDNHFTYCLPYIYDPTARSRLWEDVFIRRTLVWEDGEFDPDLAALFQELYGYSLTTDTSHEVMVWLYGDGGNGKTVAVEILKALLGHMAVDVNFHHLGEPGNYDMAKLPGARVVFSTESKYGGSLAEEHAKRISSGETMSARPIRGAPFEFKSTAKIWWAMNDRPIIKSTSNSLWRRLKLIPFNRQFLEHEKDHRLLAKLMDELPSILNWALAGLYRLQENGAFTPSAQADAVLQEYISESNPVAMWVEERTVPAGDPVTSARGLYKDYKDWCKASGRQPLNETNFGRELKRLKVAKRRAEKGNVYALFLSNASDISETLGL